MNNMIRLSEVQQRLGNVDRSTVLKWINLGYFPNAIKNTSQIIPFWEIPEVEILSFIKPHIGKPKKVEVEKI